MKKQILYFIFILFSYSVSAQFAPDFTITDTNGEEHNLYADYLDQGQTVVIKLFFVGCPPCTAIAPDVQQMYVDWGEGEADVQFFEFSTQSFDTDIGINTYLNNLNVTIPASGQGGGYDASEPYRMAEFGSYFGTPSFAVIAPDRNVVFFKSTSNLTQVHNAILDTGAEPVEPEEEDEEEEKEEEMAEPTNYNFEFKDAFGEDVDDVLIFIADQDVDNTTQYLLSVNGISEYEITDLESEYPGITTPKFIFTRDNKPNEDLNGIDLITIQRHILDITKITNPDLLLASDSNNNGSISGPDLIIIQKLILGIRDDFPNGASNWIFKNNDIPIDINPGNTINITVNMIKRGNAKG